MRRERLCGTLTHATRGFRRSSVGRAYVLTGAAAKELPKSDEV